ncbi:MAG: tRNA lysidine(34) synthetase TilS [Pseudomonadota bacterium]
MNESLPSHLARALERAAPKQICVGYSGGRDSHVLLHALAALCREREVALRAIHINHQLQPESAQWASHCESVCRALSVRLFIQTVTVGSTASVEASARAARYGAFAEMLSADEHLALAHHQRDQAETILLRLLRGAGPSGLAAMREQRRLQTSWVWRPMLNIAEEVIATYARAHRLDWIEDPSNDDPRFERNFLRHQILPRLRERWPALDETIARGGALSRLAAAHLDDTVHYTIDSLSDDGGETISVSGLLGLEPWLAEALLNRWVPQRGGDIASLDQIRELIRQLRQANLDRAPRLEFSNTVVQRYRDRLYVEQGSPPRWSGTVRWKADDALVLPHGQLTIERDVPGGIDNQWLGKAVEVRPRSGGERITLPRRPTKRLKDLFQELAVPPWRRGDWPLVFFDGQFAVVPEIGVDRAFVAPDGTRGWQIRWLLTQ